METSDLEISFRTWNALAKAGVTDTAQLTCKTERHIIDLRGIGYGALAELRKALGAHGLYMGMTGPAYNEKEPNSDD